MLHALAMYLYTTWEDMFPNNRFVYNIISDEMHNQINFTKREAGCQITFIPYSASNLQLFIAAIFPKILNILKSGGENMCFSWSGDLSALNKMKIDLSTYGNSAESYSLVERQI